MIDGFKLINNFFNTLPQDGYPIGSGQAGALIYGSQRNICFNISDTNAWVEYVQEKGKEKSCRLFGSFQEFSELVARGDFKKIFAEHARRMKNFKVESRLALLAKLTIQLDEDEIVILDFKDSLDVETGIYDLFYETRERTFNLQAFFESERNLLCIRISETLKKGDSYSLRVSFDFGRENKNIEELKLSYTKDKITSRISFRKGNKSGLESRAFAKKVVAGIDGKKAFFDITATGETYLFATVGKDHRLPGIKNPADFYNLLLTNHQNDFASFYGRSSISIPDQKLAFLHKYSLYLIKSSSHPTSKAIGLVGLFNDGQKSWFHYTNDMDTQLNYCHLLPLNYPEYLNPYFKLFSKMLSFVRKETEQYFGVKGACYPPVSDIKGHVLSGYCPVVHWTGASAFVALNFCAYYEYTLDEKFLEKTAFPVVKECLNFYCGILVEGKDGKLHLFPSYVPEEGEGSYEAFGTDSSLDLQLVKQLFRFGIKAATTLRKNYPEWQQIYSRVADLPEKNGAVVEFSDKDFPDSHRHPSVCAGIFPANILLEEDFPKAEKTFDRFLAKGTRLWVGWTYPWIAACAARLLRPVQARDYLYIFADWFCSQANLLHMNNDFTCRGFGSSGPKVFTIEGNMITGAAITEMLFQSYDGIIKLFPAIPEDWKECSFRNFLAVGAFEVSAAKSGDSFRAEIKSVKDGELRLNLGSGKLLSCNRKVETTQNILSCIMKIGETAELCYEITEKMPAGGGKSGK